jgi:hypothetical protein
MVTAAPQLVIDRLEQALQSALRCGLGLGAACSCETTPSTCLSSSAPGAGASPTGPNGDRERDFTPHDFRHTFVSLARRGGVRLEVISLPVTHRSVTTTADVYSHLELEDLRAELEAAGLLEQPLHGPAVDAESPRDLALRDPVRRHRPHLRPLQRAPHLLVPPVSAGPNRSSVRAQTVVTGRAGGALFAARYRRGIGRPASDAWCQPDRGEYHQTWRNAEGLPAAGRRAVGKRRRQGPGAPPILLVSVTTACWRCTGAFLQELQNERQLV